MWLIIDIYGIMLLPRRLTQQSNESRNANADTEIGRGNFEYYDIEHELHM